MQWRSNLLSSAYRVYTASGTRAAVRHCPVEDFKAVTAADRRRGSV
jgi:hypothetical protein